MNKTESTVLFFCVIGLSVLTIAREAQKEVHTRYPCLDGGTFVCSFHYPPHTDAYHYCMEDLTDYCHPEDREREPAPED